MKERERATGPYNFNSSFHLGKGPHQECRTTAYHKNFKLSKEGLKLERDHRLTQKNDNVSESPSQCSLPAIHEKYVEMDKTRGHETQMQIQN